MLSALVIIFFAKQSVPISVCVTLCAAFVIAKQSVHG